jgi:hypothetical protein
MGKHIYLQSAEDVESFLLCQYVLGGCYNISTAFIKMSLLLQYGRIFEPRTWTRRFTYVLLVFVAAWGFIFAFLGWFPCIPHISDFWKVESGRTHCFAGASTDKAEAVASIQAHGGSNMGLDVIILLLAVRLLFFGDTEVDWRGKLALLSMGSM